MKATDLKLTEKELKVLTWRDDVDGMGAYLVGDAVMIVYKAMPSYSPIKMSIDDVIEVLEDIRRVEVERLVANN